MFAVDTAQTGASLSKKARGLQERASKMLKFCLLGGNSVSVARMVASWVFLLRLSFGTQVFECAQIRSMQASRN